jgi:hypothetical protein
VREVHAHPGSGRHDLRGVERLVVPDRRDHERHAVRERLRHGVETAVTDHCVQRAAAQQFEHGHARQHQRVTRQLTESVLLRREDDRLDPIGQRGQRSHRAPSEVHGEISGERPGRHQHPPT